MLRLKVAKAPKSDVADNLARRLRQVLMESVVPVSEHPYLFRQSQTIPAMREIVAHPNYIVYYRVTASCIEVVNVIHTRREFPGQE